MNTTLYPDINLLLDRLLSQIRYILQEKLVGLYLYGSLVTGDFDHAVSDIDLMAVTASEISHGELDELHKMHRQLALQNPEWDNRIEIAYLSLTALRTFRTHRSPIAIISPGEPFHVKEAGIDWLINWYVIRENGVALFGPASKSIIDPITQEEYVQAVRKQAAEWVEYITHSQELKFQAYAILTMCRAFYTSENGEQVSKLHAAQWAQTELPEWADLIRRAIVWRSEQNEGHVDPVSTYPETVRFVNCVTEIIVSEPA